MKTYRGTFNSYTIDELSDKAKEHAYEKWLPNADFPIGDEYRATLEEFCRIFDVNCYDWSYSSYYHNFRFSITNDDAENVSGMRLATYVWNNYAPYITKGKYMSKTTFIDGKYKTVSRRSKVNTTMEGCPLTGYFADSVILDSIIKCLKYEQVFESYEDLIRDCLENFFKACREDCKWHESMERFVEESIANEWEYDIDGNAFCSHGFMQNINIEEIETEA